MQATQKSGRTGRNGLRMSITYGFLILAAYLMMADCYRLVKAQNPHQAPTASRSLAGI